MDTSPIIDVKAEEVVFPLCTRCGQRLEKIRSLDYGDIKVVFHDIGCVIGVLSNESTS